MRNIEIPFNIGLLQLTPDKLVGLKQVTSQDIFNGATRNFAEDGLFSVSIFGPVGSKQRSRNFAYIDLKIEVFHPHIYKTLVKLKRLYGEIMAGRAFAKWDEGVSDFVPATPMDGETGYHFFVKHWENIVFLDSDSESRQINVKIINEWKQKKKVMQRRLVVIPAGIRDVEFDGERIKQDEVNPFYRSILSIANTISEASVRTSPEILNAARMSLQNKFNDLYDYFGNIALDGKQKLFLGKFASRRIYNGTRNVITAMDTGVSVLGSKNSPGLNNTVVGLYQMLKAILPVSIHLIRNGLLAEVFKDIKLPVGLVDKKTWKAVDVSLPPEYFDRWTTVEGIEKTISAFANQNIRHKYLEINGYYLALLYIDPKGNFKVMRSIEELPEGYNKEHVRPLSFVEFLYISVYKTINTYPIFFTRYPVAGMGSIFPSMAFVKTTVKPLVARELTDEWQPGGDDCVAPSFPVPGDTFMNSMSPHSSRLANSQADFDGDTASGNSVYSDEARAEVVKYFTKRRAYIGIDGKLMASTGVVTVEYVLHNLTGD